MKTPLLTFAIIVAGLLVPAQFAIAQNYKTFTANCEPTEISSDEASTNARSLTSTCGFSSAYMNRYDIQDLLKIDQCVGVRFYISKEKTDQSYADVTAVAINEQGNELKSDFQRTYLMVRDLTKSYPSYAIGLNVYQAERCVNNLSSGKSGIEPYTGYLGRDALTQLLESGGDGLRIYPSNVELDGRMYRSMTFGAVSARDGSVRDVSGTYLQAMHPCPIDCGGDGEMNYLWSSDKD